jgi:hypothetical protein
MMDHTIVHHNTTEISGSKEACREKATRRGGRPQLVNKHLNGAATNSVDFI